MGNNGYNKVKCFLAMAAMTLMASCEHISLFMGHTEGDIPVNVVIHYDGEPEEKLPSGMDVYWFADRGDVWSTEFSNRNGGRDYLFADIFTPLCLDYDGNENLLFRGNGTRSDFEVYNRTPDARPIYCDSVTQLPGEIVVMEAAAPHTLYIDAAPQRVNTLSTQWNDTLTVHFYPKNVLREYSFMIYGIEGAQNMVRGGGAITGMSASYWPATGDFAARPATVLFSRVEAIVNGQKGRPGKPWNDDEKALFAAKNPNWNDPENGWTGDWIIGAFSTFGPVDPDEHRIRLTIEVYSTGNNYYYGAWGYWHGEWEDEARPEAVRNQLINATGNGAPDERIEQQARWRKQNAGFDILLDNDGHLPFIPDDAPATEGGFDLAIDDWGEIIDVPVTPGNTRENTLKLKAESQLLNESYTPGTLPGFVVNGIWKKTASEFERFFNEQYVYRNENGKFEYQPLTYWPREGVNINFQAYAPPAPPGLAGGLKNAGDLDDSPDPTITYDIPVLPTGDVDEGRDFLVAVQKLPIPPLSAVVRLNFKHALARFRVAAKTQANAGGVIMLNELRMNNLYTKGTLTLKPDNDGALSYSTGIPGEGSFRYSGDGAVVLWENPEKRGNYVFVAGEKKLNDTYTDINDRYYYIMPQVFDGEMHIYVKWSIYDNSPPGGLVFKKAENVTLKLQQSVVSAFEAGRTYRLLIALSEEREPPWGTGE